MATEQRKFWGQKTFCLVTGASQGIGRNFAIEFCRKFAAGSSVILLARSLTKLEETRKLIVTANPDVEVEVHSVDLSLPDAKKFKEILSSYAKSRYDFYLLVNNAGSVGNTKHSAAAMNDLEEWSRYMSLNLYSTTMLTSEFLQVFNSGQRCILNITSLCALQPFKSMGYYCIGKASREMYFRVLAEENPSLDILNYSPGPVDTDMVSGLIDNLENEETRSMFVSMKSSNTLVTLGETTKKCIDVLASGKYTSGGRFDYFDPL
uniref:Sepiapterin reductase n=1 Tax=Clastoptera arizonana TaxID=38151 RepID=A0A1B6CZF9_9HEMI